MIHDYSAEALAQGRDNQQRLQENASTFGTLSKTENVTQSTQLDKPRQRMAGRVGQRALEYMTDPQEMERTNAWMEAFGLSNDGARFNQAKMMGGVMPPEDNGGGAA